jgi:hypothetical protein
MRYVRPPGVYDQFAVGQWHRGFVRNRAAFGVFVELSKGLWGVDGLLHFAQTPHRTVAKGLLLDQSVEVVLVRVDRDAEKFGVALPPDPEWLSTDVVALARDIMADRAFERLPIMADALEDAGCRDAAVLSHCRTAQPSEESWLLPLLVPRSSMDTQPGPHVDVPRL